MWKAGEFRLGSDHESCKGPEWNRQWTLIENLGLGIAAFVAFVIFVVQSLATKSTKGWN